MVFRILAFLVLLLSVLFWPFWISVILGLAGMIYFSFFWEATLSFLLMDLLYGVKGGGHTTLFMYFIISVVILCLIEAFKKKLKFHRA